MQTWKALALAVSFVLHWTLVIGLSTYLFWASPKTDWIYLGVWALLYAQWIFHGSCYLSTFERSMLYNNTDATQNIFINPSLQFYTGGNLWTFALAVFITAMYLVNFAYVLHRIGVPTVANVALTGGFAVYCAYWRHKEYLHIMALKHA